MTKHEPTNRRDALAKAAKKLGVRMPQIQLLLAQERFIARVFSRPGSDRFVWKGGSLLLRLYTDLEHPRFTVDVDLLARAVPMADVVRELSAAAALAPGDGFTFGAPSVSEMERDTPYGGYRLEFPWTMDGRAGSQALRVDVCAGDTVEPRAVALTDLALEPDAGEDLSVLVYPAEYIYAEKIETCLRFGTGNSRLKDFVDLWTLQRQTLDLAALTEAIKRCFQTRGSKLDLGKLQDIASDADFASVLQRNYDRNPVSPEIPGMTAVLRDISAFAEKIWPS